MFYLKGLPSKVNFVKLIFHQNILNFTLYLLKDYLKLQEIQERLNNQMIIYFHYKRNVYL